MTTFINGPAEGRSLALKRSPKFLRVTLAAGNKLDALDQPNDEPMATETIFAYRLAENKGAAHINMGGGRGGFYPLSDYVYVDPQPDSAIMRDNKRWQQWCMQQP